MTSLRGYEFFTDENTGERLSLRLSTGETSPIITFEAPMGSILLTPEAQESYKQRQAEEYSNAVTRFYKKDRQFYFAVRDEDYHNIDAATMARLIYLATYLGYDGILCRYHTEDKITRRDLPDILHLTGAPTSQFWKAVKGKYVFEDEGKQLHLSHDFFHRGKLMENTDKQYQQFYIDAVRELYLKTPARQHKHLGYIFQMLPFINVEYNVLCHNPDEKDMTKIQFMTPEQFCDAIGYDKDQKWRLMDVYEKITFPTKEEGEQAFCNFVSNSRRFPDDRTKIVVNPYVLYHGHHWDKVQLIGEFCRR